jgi:hypothetical protein
MGSDGIRRKTVVGLPARPEDTERLLDGLAH